ncbi:MAG: hypothetical protein ACR2HX_16265 [Pyrinomonadaceae bacterium]
MQKRTWINHTVGTALLLLSLVSQSAFAQVGEDDTDLDAMLVKAKVKRPQRIDKTPFVELLAKAKKMKDSGELDLSGTIEMSIAADRNPTGSLSNIMIAQKDQKPKLKELATDLVTLVSQSRVLDFLEGASPLQVTLRLDQTKVTINASTEVASEKRAAQLARVYNLLFYAGSVVKRGRDEEVLYKSAQASAKGKMITVKFDAARRIIATLLSKHVEAP